MIRTMEDGKLTKKEKKEIKKQEWAEKEKALQKKQLFKKLSIWIGITGVIVISVFGLVKLTDSSSTSVLSSEVQNIAPLSKEDVLIGNKNSKVVLTEYSDFQCPGCRNAHPLVKQLLSEYGEKIAFNYRFFPLPQHLNGEISAQAGYAAYLQGKFAEMSDLLFENQTTWEKQQDPKEIFVSYAQKLSLDIVKFKTDMEADSTQKLVRASGNSASASGINSTPTFFLNGKNIQLQNYNQLKTLIDEELAK